MLKFNTPPGVTQVGSVTVGAGGVAQGVISVDINAPTGDGVNPPMIGLNQVVDSCNQDSNKVPLYVIWDCPSSLTIGAQNGEFPFVSSPAWNPPVNNRTGVGAYVEMQANPASSNFDGAQIWETVWNTTAGSTACSQDVMWILFKEDICYAPGGVGLVGAERWLIGIDPYKTDARNYKKSGIHNVIYDEHAYARNPNLLGSGPQLCTASCKQMYYCGPAVLGTYTIQYTLQEINPGPPSPAYTLVTVTKSAN
jgi:hypothetical protein